MKCCPWGVRGCGGSCYVWLSAQDGKALDLMKKHLSSNITPLTSQTNAG